MVGFAFAFAGVVLCFVWSAFALVFWLVRWCVLLVCAVSVRCVLCLLGVCLFWFFSGFRPMNIYFAFQKIYIIVI